MSSAKGSSNGQVDSPKQLNLATVQITAQMLSKMHLMLPAKDLLIHVWQILKNTFPEHYPDPNLESINYLQLIERAIRHYVVGPSSSACPHARERAFVSALTEAVHWMDTNKRFNLWFETVDPFVVPRSHRSILGDQGAHIS